MGKVRLDFVTNSSASSFIIDKNKFDGEFSVEGVFQMLKSLYKEAGELYNEVVTYVAKKYGLTEKGDYYYNKKDERVYIDDFFHKISDELREKYDVDSYSLCYSDGCEHRLDEYKTYEDYTADGNTSEYGFSICDYRLDSTEITEDTIETIMWYTDPTPGYVLETRSALLGLTSTTYDDLVRKEMLKLGEICIHSQHGQIDISVVPRLEKLCVYSCDHMG